MSKRSQQCELDKAGSVVCEVGGMIEAVDEAGKSTGYSINRSRRNNKMNEQS
jgi:hypothetical protein